MGELPHPPEGRSKAVGLLLKDAKIAKVPLTVITFMPAARMGDSTSYGGVITVEYPTVLIGG